MVMRKTMIMLVTFLVPFASGSRVQAQEVSGPGKDAIQSQVAIEIGSLRITNRIVELRCEIKNDAGRDIWVYAVGPKAYDPDGVRGTNAELFPDRTDPGTLVILRRMNLPYPLTVLGAEVSVPYARLRAGQRRAEIFVLALPVEALTPLERKLMAACEKGVPKIRRLAFEIGYYTQEDIEKMPAGGGLSHVRFDESGEQILIRGLRGAGWKTERAAKIVLDRVSIDCKEWLKPERRASSQPPLSIIRDLPRVFVQNSGVLDPNDWRYARDLFTFDPALFDEATRQIADVYIQLAEGKFPPVELTQRLDRILSKADREKLLEDLHRKRALASAPQAPRLTPLQALQDLFYGFLLDSKDYRYARELFAVDRELLDARAMRIANIYIQVAEGKLNPAELAQHLDKILSQTERQKLLEELQEKQAARDRGASHGG
jgi:hypothetical protein